MSDATPASDVRTFHVIFGITQSPGEKRWTKAYYGSVSVGPEGIDLFRGPEIKINVTAWGLLFGAIGGAISWIIASKRGRKDHEHFHHVDPAQTRILYDDGTRALSIGLDDGTFFEAKLQPGVLAASKKQFDDFVEALRSAPDAQVESAHLGRQSAASKVLVWVILAAIVAAILIYAYHVTSKPLG